MISQETYKREKRRLATAENRFVRARRLVPPNPFAAETDGAEKLEAACVAAEKLYAVAREGLEIFKDEGYPDAWANWERAAEDASYYLKRQNLQRAAITLRTEGVI